MIAPVIQFFDELASRLPTPCVAGFSNERSGSSYSIKGNIIPYFEEHLRDWHMISSRQDRLNIGESLQKIKPFDSTQPESQYIYGLYKGNSIHYLVKIRFVDALRGGVLNYFSFYPLSVEAIDTQIKTYSNSEKSFIYHNWLKNLWSLVRQNSFVINKLGGVSVLYLDYNNHLFILLMLKEIIHLNMTQEDSFFVFQLEDHGIINKENISSELLQLMTNIKIFVEGLGESSNDDFSIFLDKLLRSIKYQKLAKFEYKNNILVIDNNKEVDADTLYFRSILREALDNYGVYLLIKYKNEIENQIKNQMTWVALNLHVMRPFSNANVFIDDTDVISSLLCVL